MRSNAQAASEGRRPAATASACARGVSWNACAVMTSPIQIRMPRVASKGTACRTAVTAPKQHSRLITIPFSAEYPMRAPMAFHPGCPIYRVVGNALPKNAAAIVPAPFIASEGIVS